MWRVQRTNENESLEHDRSTINWTPMDRLGRLTARRKFRERRASAVPDPLTRFFFCPQAEVISEDEYFNREEQCVDRLECIKQVR